MIKIGAKAYEIDEINKIYELKDIELKMVETLVASSEVYQYESINHLKFELNMRSNIILSSRELHKSHMRFEVFRESKCNEDCWTRMDNGGFLLKENVKPYDGIMDIFRNGSKYATECATAMVIIYYRAISNLYGEELFNKIYTKVELMNWHNLDRNLYIATYRNMKDYLPGDCRYFKNPDVNPLSPEWQGENTIDLGDGNFYGHGIGIVSRERIIKVLNAKRKDGAKEEAYLTETVTKQNYRNLADKTSS